MTLGTLILRKELNVRRANCCCTLCELLTPIILVAMLILGKMNSSDIVGSGQSFTPATLGDALSSMGPTHFMFGATSGESSDVAVNASANASLDRTSAPPAGGVILPIELYLFYNHFTYSLLGNMEDVSSIAGSSIRSAIDSSVVAVVPDTPRVRGLMNETFAAFRALSAAFHTYIELSRARSAALEAADSTPVPDGTPTINVSGLGPWAGLLDSTGIPVSYIGNIPDLSGLLTSLPDLGSGLDFGSGFSLPNGSAWPPGTAWPPGGGLPPLDMDLSSLLASLNLPQPGAGSPLSSALLASLTAPTLTELYFDDAADVDARVDDGLPVWAAIVFDEVPAEGAASGTWKYTLRLNYTQVPTTAPPLLNRRARGGYTDAFMSYYYSGTLSLQEALDRAILRMSGGAAGGGAGRRLQSAPFASPPLTYGLPYPKASYTVSDFIDYIKSLLAMLVVFSMVVPMFGVIGTLEKEERLREQLLISGVPSAQYYTAFFVVNGANFLIIALFIAAELAIVLARTPFSLLWVFVSLFALASLTFGVAFSPFFTNARIASIVVTIAYFVTLFVEQAAFTDSVEMYSPAALGFASLLPPVAFALGVKDICDAEYGGQGVDWEAAWDGEQPFSAGRAMLMLFVDTLLYAALFWYLDQTWPSSFGIRKPWYFPCLPSYWLGGVRATHGTPSTAVLVSSTKLATPPPSPPPSPGDTELAAPLEPAAASEHQPLAVEEGPPADKRGVRCRKVRKVYADGHVAVHSLDLDMHPNQITGLLGANGAGKTTTISMLTGLLPATRGEMLIDGLSVSTAIAQIRKALGVCPQLNTIFPALTPTEHFRLYAAIKGVSGEALRETVGGMLRCVQLNTRAHTPAKSLSGGQKRKVCLGNALIGGSTTIFLDEPTSGMDPHARRFTWELLRGQKHGRTLVLTTHFLDEAEVLSDRIAIMAQGALKAMGTAAFLKARFGLGYRLTATKKPPADGGDGAAPATSEGLMALVSSHIPQAALLDDGKRAIEVQLPGTDVTRFTGLFAAVEEQLDTLGCEAYGVNTTTLEDVFLKVNALDIDKRPAATPGADVGKARGGCCGAFHGMLVKKALVARRDIAFTLCTWLFPPITMLLAIALLNALQLPVSPPLVLDTSAAISPRYPHPVAMLTPANSSSPGIVAANLSGWAARELQQCTGVVTCPSDALAPGGGAAGSPLAGVVTGAPGEVPLAPGALPASMQGIVAGLLGNISALLSPAALGSAATSLQGLQALQTPAAPRRQCPDEAFSVPVDCVSAVLEAFGAEDAPAAFVDTPSLTTLAFNSTSLHALPTLLASTYSARLRAATGGAFSIETTLHPLPVPSAISEFEDITLRVVKGFMMSILILLPFSFAAAAPVAPLVRERASGSKQIQFVCGARPTVYWLATWLWDMVTLCGICGLVMIVLAPEWGDAFTGTPTRGAATFLLLVLFCLNALFFASMVSYLFKGYTQALISLISFHLLTGFAFAFGAFAFSAIEGLKDVAKLLKLGFFPLFPAYSLAFGMQIMSLQVMVQSIQDSIDAILEGNSTMAIGMREANYTSEDFRESMEQPLTDLGFPTSTNPFAADALGRLYTFLFVEALLFAGLTLFFQYFASSASLRMGYDKCVGGVSSAAPSQNDASGVLEDDAVAAERAAVDALIASGGYQPGGPALIISHLRKQFSGVGGKLAVRDLCVRIEAGEVFGFLGTNGAGKSTTFGMLTGEKVPTTGNAYLFGSSILTAQSEIRRFVGYCPQHDALEAYARLKGVPARDIDGQVDELLADLSLAPFANKLAHQLSGGNKRKLCVGIAMIGRPQMILLDEPSSGMDAGSMRFLWSVIKRRTTECCTILTTHSMEECEALCGRIGVMVDGVLRTLGPIQTLKSKYGQGFRVSLRLDPAADADAVLRNLTEAFEGTTLDSLERPLMEINVPQAAKLSALFARLEASKQSLKVVEASVTQTTLEQVFVKMAKSRGAASGGGAAEFDVAASKGVVSESMIDVKEETDGGRTVKIDRAPGQRLGLDVAESGAKLAVSMVYDGYAAALAKIRVGEVLLAVNGQPTAGLDRTGVLELIGKQPSGAIAFTFEGGDSKV